MSNVINRVEASTLFVAVNKLGIKEKLSMNLACMAMKQKLDRYQQKVWKNHAIIAAALLDPYQKGSMLDERTKKAAIAYIRGLLPSPPPTSSSTLPPSTPISSTTRQDWLKRECKKKDGPVQSTLAPSEQLDAYMNEIVKDEGDLVLHWWVRKGNIAYPPLAPLVQELVAVCATSAPSERVFSAGRAVVTYKRARLTTESIETLVTVKCWLRGNNTKWYDNVHYEDVDMRVVADEMVWTLYAGNSSLIIVLTFKFYDFLTHFHDFTL